MWIRIKSGVHEVVAQMNTGKALSDTKKSLSSKWYFKEYLPAFFIPLRSFLTRLPELYYVSLYLLLINGKYLHEGRTDFYCTDVYDHAGRLLRLQPL